MEGLGGDQTPLPTPVAVAAVPVALALLAPHLSLATGGTACSVQLTEYLGDGAEGDLAKLGSRVELALPKE